MTQWSKDLVNTANIWRNALARLDTTPIDPVAKNWLQNAHLVDASLAVANDAHNGDVRLLTLQVPNEQARDIVNIRWQSVLEKLLTDLSGEPIRLDIQYMPELATQSTMGHDDFTQGREVSYERTTSAGYMTSSYYQISPRPPLQNELPYRAGDLVSDWENEQRAHMLMHNRLNSRYTFDAFIVGNSNRLAHAASLAVAEAPGESYNPLFLYGGVGLGKTHLLHAIGHQGVQTGLTVLYVSSEQFTNEIVNAIRYRTTEEFRNKYRSVDILLVDDIQFIAGKESTEEEFFHTFNSLYEMSKQIVICSDRPPKAIVSLEERLRSRFEWGLIADIQPPDLETRMAILRVKADVLRYQVPDEIIAYIAGRVQNNIRELEGSLNRLMAYQQLHHTSLNMDVARAAMSSLGSDTREPELSGTQIAQAVAEHFHISLEAMCGKQRDKYIVTPRQVAMYLIRQETSTSLFEIGKMFGGRDHSTVLHACEKIDRILHTNANLRRDVIAIREQLMRG
jgi:chromosomal replication initiator protein